MLNPWKSWTKIRLSSGLYRSYTTLNNFWLQESHVHTPEVVIESSSLIFLCFYSRVIGNRNIPQEVAFFQPSLLTKFEFVVFDSDVLLCFGSCANWHVFKNCPHLLVKLTDIILCRKLKYGLSLIHKENFPALRVRMEHIRALWLDLNLSFIFMEGIKIPLSRTPRISLWFY